MKQQYTTAMVTNSSESSIGSGIYRLELTPLSPFPAWKAGQFVMLSLRSPKHGIAFARPFSIASTTEDTITLYIQVRGKETQYIQHCSIGDTLSLWGPLGNHFSAPVEKTLLIGGGIGIAPFVSYTHQYPTENTTFLFGHRLPLSYYPYECIASRCNASAFQDIDTPSLQVFLQTIENAMLEHATGKVLACGPLPLLRTIQQIALKHTITAELSLEETMYCGVGACLGCVCKTTEEHAEERLRSRYAQTCTYGPIFIANTIHL